MKPALRRSMMSSVRVDWQTPDDFLDLVRMHGPIMLDPCSSADNPTKAANFFTEADDGLERPWDVPGLIYVNPPYGRELRWWAPKIALEGAGGSEIIALLPARTDTNWFQKHIARADVLCFWSGRLTFRGAPDPALFPSVVAYFGDRAKAFKRVFTGKGWIV